MNALELKSINKSYKNVKAVDNISFEVPKGSIFGLLGPNGAGKTTLLRIITGIFMPDSGEVLVNGKISNLLSNSTLIGYMPEERGLYKKMKAEEQAIYLAQLKGLSYTEAKTNVQNWFEKLDMNSWKNKKVDELSKGMGQKLQFVCTVIHKPAIIILDEPFTGLDPMNAEIIKQEIFELSKQGTTVLFSTHRMEQVEEICEKIVLVNKGQVILNSNVREARQQFYNNEFVLKGSNLSQFNLTDSFNMISSSEHEVVVSLKEGKKIQDLMFEISKQNELQINSISENLPTLNEIFIKLVS